MTQHRAFRSFRDWLARFEAEDSPAGHVASLAMDARWPQGPGGLEAYAIHLVDAGSDDDYEALGQAWEQYEASRSQPGPLGLHVVRRPG